MAETILHGIPASPGAGLGRARLVAAAAPAAPRGGGAGREAELARARAALEAACAEVSAAAARLRAGGHGDEAEIVETGVLMAQDPALDAAVAGALGEDGTAEAAILAAAEEHAARIASLGDERLAARADDVRSLGRRAARLAVGETAAQPGAAGDAVLVAADLGPADVADVDGVVAIALSAGGPTAHAAIVARSLGIPMVVGVGEALLAVREGAPLAVDGTAGDVVLAPAPQRAVRRAAPAAVPVHGPVATTDGHRVRVLVNAGGAAEVRAGLAAGAEGVGLLRTELAFLRAPTWPAEDDHRAALEAALAPLGADLPATVRLLDLGGDKAPPFLGATPGRGLEVLLARPVALAAQLRAIAAVAAGREVRVLLPMVHAPAQVDEVRSALGDAALALGAMVETPGAAERADVLAAVSDFLSIGTNDLAHETLGTDRFGTGHAVAHHPAVLRHIAATAHAAAARGRALEVCGEAASDPIAMPLLVGLGVDELSVGAARVGVVRCWVRRVSRALARDVARRALTCATAAEVADLVRAELGGFAEGGDAACEGGDGLLAVGAEGPQHEG